MLGKLDLKGFRAEGQPEMYMMHDMYILIYIYIYVIYVCVTLIMCVYNIHTQLSANLITCHRSAPTASPLPFEGLSTATRGRVEADHIRQQIPLESGKCPNLSARKSVSWQTSVCP